MGEPERTLVIKGKGGNFQENGLCRVQSLKIGRMATFSETKNTGGAKNSFDFASKGEKQRENRLSMGKDFKREDTSKRTQLPSEVPESS